MIIFLVCATPNFPAEFLTFLPYFKQGSVFLVVSGNETTEQDKIIKSVQNSKYYKKS